MGGVMVVRALNIEDNVSKVVILIATRPIIQQRDVGKLNLMKKIVFLIQGVQAYIWQERIHFWRN